MRASDPAEENLFPEPAADALPRALRTRERLQARGARSLTLQELLALLIDARPQAATARRTAARLLRAETLGGLAALDLAAWQARRGVGRVAAVRLCAAFELGRRAFAAPTPERRPLLSGPRQAYEQVRHLGRARKEHLVGLYLDAQNGLLARETVSIGSLNTTRTHPREILYPAICHLALGFVLAHNHPSGGLDPSPEDVEFTRAVRRAGEMMGIELYDHLIIAGDGYVSLRERGLL